MSTPLVAIHTPAGSAATTLRELLALLRLAAFLPVEGRDLRGSDGAIALLTLVWLAAWVVADPLLHERELVFTWRAVPDLACVFLGVLAVAWVLRRLARPAPEYRQALLLTLGALPLAMLGEIGSWKLVDSWLWALTGVLSLYALLLFDRGLRVITGRRQPIAMLGAAAAVAAVLVSLAYLQANPRLWTRADERLDLKHTSGPEWARMARAQFAQQARIDAQLARMPPQDPARSETFFVGFAGYGREAIFAREIDLAARVIGEKFGAAAHSLRLVNDKQDVEAWPIATEPGLRHALAAVGQAMGEDDVLFLTLASHGERHAGVHVSNEGMAATRLSPVALRAMLDEAGIAWRVIVVSACYSGSFIDALADERSIVITAAGPDRKSFGCNDRRQLTYFGEAFYRDALSGAVSLRAAFETARAALERKERASGIVPSQPRAHFGGLIEAKLDKVAPARG